MKITVDIPDSLLKQAKKLAAERNTTMKVVIECALRDELARYKHQHRKYRLVTRTFKGKGLRPGLSWNDWSALRSMNYEGRGG